MKIYVIFDEGTYIAAFSSYDKAIKVFQGYPLGSCRIQGMEVDEPNVIYRPVYSVTTYKGVITEITGPHFGWCDAKQITIRDGYGEDTREFTIQCESEDAAKEIILSRRYYES